MKNTFTFGGLLLVTVITIVTACKKDDAQKTTYEKNVALITNRNWKIVFNGYDNNNDGILDYDYQNGNENSMSDCTADDDWEFRKDGTFYMRMLGITNGCGDVDGGPFPWSLSKDSKTFNYSGEICTVLVLTDHIFRFTYPVNGEILYTEFNR